MGGFHIAVEAFARDLIKLLERHRVPGDAIREATSRLSRLTAMSLKETHAAHHQGSRAAVPSAVICRDIVMDDLVDRVIDHHIPEVELARAQRQIAAMRQEVCDARRQAAGGSFQVAALDSGIKKQDAAQDTLMHAMFQEVLMLRLKITELKAALAAAAVAPRSAGEGVLTSSPPGSPRSKRSTQSFEDALAQSAHGTGMGGGPALQLLNSSSSSATLLNMPAEGQTATATTTSVPALVRVASLRFSRGLGRSTDDTSTSPLQLDNVQRVAATSEYGTMAVFDYEAYIKLLRNQQEEWPTRYAKLKAEFDAFIAQTNREAEQVSKNHSKELQSRDAAIAARDAYIKQAQVFVAGFRPRVAAAMGHIKHELARRLAGIRALVAAQRDAMHDWFRKVSRHFNAVDNRFDVFIRFANQCFHQLHLHAAHVATRRGTLPPVKPAWHFFLLEGDNDRFEEGKVFWQNHQLSHRIVEYKNKIAKVFDDHLHATLSADSASFIGEVMNELGITQFGGNAVAGRDGLAASSRRGGGRRDATASRSGSRGGKKNNAAVSPTTTESAVSTRPADDVVTVASARSATSDDLPASVKRKPAAASSAAAAAVTPKRPAPPAASGASSARRASVAAGRKGNLPATASTADDDTFAKDPYAGLEQPATVQLAEAAQLLTASSRRPSVRGEEAPPTPATPVPLPSVPSQPLATPPPTSAAMAPLSLPPTPRAASSTPAAVSRTPAAASSIPAAVSSTPAAVSVSPPATAEQSKSGEAGVPSGAQSAPPTREPASRASSSAASSAVAAVSQPSCAQTPNGAANAALPIAEGVERALPANVVVHADAPAPTSSRAASRRPSIRPASQLGPSAAPAAVTSLLLVTEDAPLVSMRRRSSLAATSGGALSAYLATPKSQNGKPLESEQNGATPIAAADGSADASAAAAAQVSSRRRSAVAGKTTALMNRKILSNAGLFASLVPVAVPPGPPGPLGPTEAKERHKLYDALCRWKRTVFTNIVGRVRQNVVRNQYFERLPALIKNVYMTLLHMDAELRDTSERVAHAREKSATLIVQIKSLDEIAAAEAKKQRKTAPHAAANMAASASTATVAGQGGRPRGGAATGGSNKRGGNGKDGLDGDTDDDPLLGEFSRLERDGDRLRKMKARNEAESLLGTASPLRQAINREAHNRTAKLQEKAAAAAARGVGGLFDDALENDATTFHNEDVSSSGMPPPPGFVGDEEGTNAFFPAGPGNGCSNNSYQSLFSGTAMDLVRPGGAFLVQSQEPFAPVYVPVPGSKAPRDIATRSKEILVHQAVERQHGRTGGTAPHTGGDSTPVPRGAVGPLLPSLHAAGGSARTGKGAVPSRATSTTLPSPAPTAGTHEEDDDWA